MILRPATTKRHRLQEVVEVEVTKVAVEVTEEVVEVTKEVAVIEEVENEEVVNEAVIEAENGVEKEAVAVESAAENEVENEVESEAVAAVSSAAENEVESSEVVAAVNSVVVSSEEVAGAARDGEVTAGEEEVGVVQAMVVIGDTDMEDLDGIMAFQDRSLIQFLFLFLAHQSQSEYRDLILKAIALH